MTATGSCRKSKIKNQKSKAPYIEKLFHTNGKLLLTGEYFVLDGALALGLPVRFGQELSVVAEPGLDCHYWLSLGHEGHPWFEGEFSSTGAFLGGGSSSVGRRLESLFKGIEKQRPGFLLQQPFLRFQTRLSFPRQWGLGSSSTLVAALAEWAEVDPFQLLADTFGGSGYDVACAGARHPILFQRRNGRPQFVECPFVPPFATHLCFVYLGQKQDSRQGIAHYREVVEDAPRTIAAISRLTMDFLQARTVEEAAAAVENHERLVSRALRLPRVQETHFPNFPGAVKSLGAWGGDFVMAISERPAEASRQYFRVKGYKDIFTYEELAL